MSFFIFQTEMPNVNTKIENESEEKNKIMQNLVQEMNNEFAKLQELVNFIKIKLCLTLTQIETESGKRVETENTFVQTISDVMQRIKEEFNKEREIREEYEDNIFTLLEETSNRLVSNNAYIES